jgi:hypothetical protein
MSQSASFLSSRLPIGGVVAYSIRRGNDVLAADCFSKSLYPSSTEEMLARIVRGGGALLPCGEQPARYCWTFEGHRVYVAARPDGVCLALLVENNANAKLVSINETLQGFLDMSED